MKAKGPPKDERGKYKEVDDDHLPKTFTSQEQLEAAVGIPKSVIKLCKRKGCGAFVHGRVKLKELLKWYFEHEVELQTEDFGEKLKEENFKIKRLERLEHQKRLMPRQEVIDFSKSVMAILFAEIDRVLLNEGPRKLQGMNLNEMTKYCVDERERIRKLSVEQLKTIEL